jgi:hypothetical protein
MDDKPQASPWKSARITLSTQGQTKDKVTEIVGGILGRGGCYTCGRLISLEVEFGDDPGPDLGKLGVTSVQVE